MKKFLDYVAFSWTSIVILSLVVATGYGIATFILTDPKAFIAMGIFGFTIWSMYRVRDKLLPEGKK